MRGRKFSRTVSVFAFVFCILAGATANVRAEEKGQETEEPKAEIEIQFEHSYDDDGNEQAVISALGKEGDVLWSHTTGAYPGAQLQRVSELGVHEDNYYYCEDGTIRALELSTGETVWENSDFRGSPADWDFDDDGNLYVCGSLVPDLFAASWDGGWTILDVDSLDSGYFEPYELEVLEENRLRIRFAGDEESGYFEEGRDVIVELRDVDTAFEKDTETDSESGGPAAPKAGLRKEVAAWYEAEPETAEEG